MMPLTEEEQKICNDLHRAMSKSGSCLDRIQWVYFCLYPETDWSFTSRSTKDLIDLFLDRPRRLKSRIKTNASTIKSLEKYINDLRKENEEIKKHFESD